MQNHILDTPDYDFNEVRQNLLKVGLTDVYEKKGYIVVRKTETVQVKIKNNGQGYQVILMLPQIGNGAQAFFSIVSISLFIYLDIPYAFLTGIVAGYGASILFYWPKSNKLKNRVEEAVRGIY